MKIAPFKLHFDLQMPSNTLLGQSLKLIGVEYELIVHIEKNCLHQGQYFLKSKKIHTTSSAMIASDFVQEINGIEVNTAQFSEIFPFSIKIQCANNNCKIAIARPNLIIELTLMPQARFVRNSTLNQALQEEGEDWGLLSMDKSGRILIEGKKCLFPITGIWCRNSKDLQHLETYQSILAYLRASYQHKCKFLYEQRDYSYFVKIPARGIPPQLYIVSWTETEEVINQQEFTLSEVTALEISSQSAPNRLLRTIDKPLIELVDFSTCSPIKFPEQTTAGRSDKSSRESELENECARLRQKVKSYEMNINILREEVVKLRNEIRFGSKSKGIENSVDSLKSPKAFQNQNAQKILTSSDLKTQNFKGSFQTTNTIQVSSSPTKLSKLLLQSSSTKAEEQDERDPWEYLQLVE